MSKMEKPASGLLAWVCTNKPPGRMPADHTTKTTVSLLALPVPLFSLTPVMPDLKQSLLWVSTP